MSRPQRRDLPSAVALIVAAASVAALIAAYGAQYFGGLAPCPLCLYQRPPYWIAAPAGLLAFALNLPRLRAAALALAAAALAVGTFIAIYHVSVEQHWWGGLPGCRGPANAAEELEEIVRLLQGRALGSCDAVPWTLFGLSMAAYNAAFGAGLAVLAAVGTAGAWRRMRRGGKG